MKNQIQNLQLKNEPSPHTLQKGFAQIQIIFQNCFQPLFLNNDNIDNSNNDNNNADGNTGSNNKIIYDINNKDIYRKPKRKQTDYRNALKTMHKNVDAVH